MKIAKARHAWKSLKPNLKISTISLILSNLIPLFGVLLFHWSVFIIMLLFWFENVIIGFFNVLKMLTVSTPADAPASTRALNNPISRVSHVFFFIIHYGIFTFVHGAFVFTLFAPKGMAGGMNSPRDTFTSGSRIILSYLLFPAIALFISHAISFYVNYIKTGENKRKTVMELMLQPYGRIVVLHITIIFGGAMTMMLGSGIWALVLLVILKIALDLGAHIMQHKESKPKPPPRPIKYNPGSISS